MAGALARRGAGRQRVGARPAVRWELPSGGVTGGSAVDAGGRAAGAGGGGGWGREGRRERQASLLVLWIPKSGSKFGLIDFFKYVMWLEPHGRGPDVAASMSKFARKCSGAPAGGRKWAGARFGEAVGWGATTMLHPEGILSPPVSSESTCIWPYIYVTGLAIPGGHPHPAHRFACKSPEGPLFPNTKYVHVLGQEARRAQLLSRAQPDT